MKHHKTKKNTGREVDDTGGEGRGGRLHYEKKKVNGYNDLMLI